MHALPSDAAAAEHSALPRAQVYVSAGYTDRAIASRIATYLASKGYAVVHERDIGSPNSEAPAAAAQAPCVIALLSRASQTSKWLNDDIELAQARDALVVVRLEHISSPILRSVMAEPVDLIGWSGEADHPGWNTLLARVDMMAGAPARRGGSRMTVMLAQTIGIVGFGIIGSLFAMPSGPSNLPALHFTETAVQPDPTAQGGAQPGTLIEPASAHRSRPARSPAPLPAQPHADALHTAPVPALAAFEPPPAQAVFVAAPAVSVFDAPAAEPLADPLADAPPTADTAAGEDANQSAAAEPNQAEAPST